MGVMGGGGLLDQEENDMGISHRFLSRRILSYTGIIALMSGPALAQASGDGEAVVLDPLVVSAPTSESPTAPLEGYVARTTATGSKTATPVQEIPQSVSIIGRQEMDDRGDQKIDEALRYSAGVFAQPFGPDSDTNWIFIRGFQATATGAFQDGLPNYSYGFGGFFIDSFTVERIEVLRGASSVLYGGSNPGGLVNTVTKRPTGQRRHYYETGINDAGTAYFGFDIDDRLSKDVTYRLVGRTAGGDGYTDFADGWRGVLSPSLTWTPNDRNRITFLANYTFIDETHNGGAFLPYVGTVVPASFGRIDPEANFTEPGIDKYIRRQSSVGYEFEHTGDRDFSFRQKFRYGHSELHEVSLYPYGYAGYATAPTSPDNTLERINFEHDTTVDTAMLDNQAEKKFATGPVQHTLLAGIDYRYFQMDQVQSSGSATPISATDPVYGAPQGARSPYIDQTLNMHQTGLYLQDQLRFGDGWLVTMNGRYDFVRNKAEGLPAYSSNKGQPSGRAGLAYTFPAGVTPYASVSTFFNPVLGMSSAIGVFKPETGEQYEVGLKYAPPGHNALFTVALFDLTRQNVVTGSGVNETQIGEVTSRGIEFEAKGDIIENLRATAAFTVLDLEITKDADASIIGKQPYIVPERQGAFRLDYTFDRNLLDGRLKGVKLGGGMRYIGSSWADYANTLKVPSATVYDAKIGYGDERWGVDLYANNLFDKTYVAACQTAYSCGYAEGRTIGLKFHLYN